MRPKQKTNAVLIFFLLITTLPLYGQFNARVGYNLGSIESEAHALIYNQFNSGRPWLSQKLKEPSTLNGMQLGLRYSYEDFVALELTWYNLYHRQVGAGTDPATNTEFSRSVSFRFSSFGLGIEKFIGPVSLGASLNYDSQEFNLKGHDLDKQKVSKEFGWSSHFFIGYNFRGSNLLKISLRPYLQVFWHDNDLTALNEALNPGDTPSNLIENYSNFGMMLVFYNGE